ncbi:hypothetical protein EDD28_2443 [Salana multivorans]|uniref:DUF7666 domain-containing protein n=1 Tax=Salana multivorans TaxID=120377 RepID=A0A3N2D300_9MICO|nr:hypothetical protein [Salana multivorans]ROR94028.1 hypothetical protein EDD28_3458 [Salana multivorans]ROR97834.1 hypothetical protein EDD28_2443 [Salana multivorans]
MTPITVTSQAEWDAAIKAHHDDYVTVYIDSPAGVVIRIDDTGSSRAVLRGSSRAVLRGSSSAVLWDSSSAELRGSSRAVLRGSSRAVLRGSSSAVLWDSSSAELRDSSSAELWGSSSAELRGSSRAELWDSSSAVLRGSSRAELWDSSSAVLRGSSSAVLRGSSSAVLWGSSRAVLWDSSSAELRAFATAHARDRSTATGGSHTAIHVHSQRATVSGGHLIDLTGIDEYDPATWVDLHTRGSDSDGLVHLYKAVDDDLCAGHQYTLTQYPIGETITDPRWRDDNQCGGGLHACPTPVMARDHYMDATRFLEVTVPVADLRPIDDTKCKAPRVTVLREVTLDGDPIEAA